MPIAPKTCAAFLELQEGHFGWSPATFWETEAVTSKVMPHSLHRYSYVISKTLHLLTLCDPRSAHTRLPSELEQHISGTAHHVHADDLGLQEGHDGHREAEAAPDLREILLLHGATLDEVVVGAILAREHLIGDHELCPDAGISKVQHGTVRFHYRGGLGIYHEDEDRTFGILHQVGNMVETLLHLGFRTR